MRILFFILIAFVLVSCSGPKNIQQETTRETKTESDISKYDSVVSRLEASFERNTQIMWQRFNELNIGRYTVNYSTPDSTGKQWKTSEEHTNLSSKSQEIGSYSEQLKDSLSKRDEQISVLFARIEELEKEKVEVVEQKISWWDQFKIDYFGFIIIFVGVIAFIPAMRISKNR